jgi:transglutaminase-like putative cysteine protease
MAIHIALRHQTQYRYDRPVALSPHIFRLRPAPHCRTPVLSYSLKLTPAEHFINWQQDPHGNYLARVVFPAKTRALTIDVDLVAEMAVFNPFDFFLEQSAEMVPFQYEPWLAKELAPYFERATAGPCCRNFSVPSDTGRRARSISSSASTDSWRAKSSTSSGSNQACRQTKRRSRLRAGRVGIPDGCSYKSCVTWVWQRGLCRDTSSS